MATVPPDDEIVIEERAAIDRRVESAAALKLSLPDRTSAFMSDWNVLLQTLPKRAAEAASA